MSKANIFPALRYKDPHAALDFLRDAFGFTEKAVHPEDRSTIQHAEMQLEDGGLVMFGAGEPGLGTAVLYCTVADVHAHHERAKAAGADITEPPTERDYGSTEYTVKDTEGHVWSFGSYDPYSA